VGGKREEGRGKREEGRGKKEEGRGRREGEHSRASRPKFLRRPISSLRRLLFRQQAGMGRGRGGGKREEGEGREEGGDKGRKEKGKF
jgi:hypothetical protein